MNYLQSDITKQLKFKNNATKRGICIFTAFLAMLRTNLDNPEDNILFKKVFKKLYSLVLYKKEYRTMTNEFFIHYFNRLLMKRYNLNKHIIYSTDDYKSVKNLPAVFSFLLSERHVYGHSINYVGQRGDYLYFIDNAYAKFSDGYVPVTAMMIVDFVDKNKKIKEYYGIKSKDDICRVLFDYSEFKDNKLFKFKLRKDFLKFICDYDFVYLKDNITKYKINNNIDDSTIEIQKVYLMKGHDNFSKRDFEIFKKHIKLNNIKTKNDLLALHSRNKNSFNILWNLLKKYNYFYLKGSKLIMKKYVKELIRDVYK